MQPSVKNLKSYSKIPLIAGSFFWVLFFNVGFFIVSFNLNAGICCSKQTEEPSTNFEQPHAPRNSLASEESSRMSCENNFYSIALHANTQIQSKSSNNSVHQDEIDLCNTHQSDQVSRPLTPYSFDLEE
ncbi:hypothetical protein EBU24_04390, partial [bacterium]|nr:hypothetical protein [bacterium]